VQDAPEHLSITIARFLFKQLRYTVSIIAKSETLQEYPSVFCNVITKT
jgi:hypothetical protein